MISKINNSVYLMYCLGARKLYKTFLVLLHKIYVQLIGP